MNAKVEVEQTVIHYEKLLESCHERIAQLERELGTQKDSVSIQQKRAENAEREMADARKQLDQSPCGVEGHRRCDWVPSENGYDDPKLDGYCRACAELAAARKGSE